MAQLPGPTRSSEAVPISPEWMRNAGYATLARSFVRPNPFPAPDPSPAAVAQRAAHSGTALEYEKAVAVTVVTVLARRGTRIQEASRP